MNAGENQIVVYQPNETVRLEYGCMLIDNLATVAFNLFEKKRSGVIGRFYEIFGENYAAILTEMNLELVA